MRSGQRPTALIGGDTRCLGSALRPVKEVAVDGMFVFPNIYMLNFNAQCDGNRRWGPLGGDEVMRMEPS